MAILTVDNVTFLLNGLMWTVILTALSFVGGIAGGIIVALLRVSDTAAIRHFARLIIAFFQGTPLLLQLFVVYYGLGLMNINLPAWLAVAIAFTLNASAFLGNIWRGGIEAVSKGQSEAAEALGLGYWSKMIDIVLPQAFRISLPATIGFLVQLLKGTSLAALVGFVELTRTGQILSNQIFKPLLVFGIVGGLYFLLCWPLSILGSRYEKKHFH